MPADFSDLESSITLPDAKISFLIFDGVNDYVQIPNSDPLNITGNAITIEAWINYSTVFNNAFINKEAQYELGISGNGTLMAAIDTVAGGASWAWIDSGVAVPTGRWVHVAVTYDGTNIRFYLDGNLVATRANNVAGAIGSEPYPLRFAARDADRNGVIDYYVPIRMRDVRIWNIVRTDAEIRDHINSELAGTEPGLVGYWKLDEGAGPTAYDSAGTNNGTIVGATWETQYTAHADLASSISVTVHDDLPGSMGVNPHNRMQAQYTVEPVYTEDLPGSLAVQYTRDLPGSIGVNPHNSMGAIYDVFQPPLLEHAFPSIADALLRESKPRLNYGGAASQPVGNHPDELRMRALYRFDFGPSSLDPLDEIEYAVIRLYKTGTSGGLVEVGVHRVDEDWSELGVTWDNQPAHSAAAEATQVLGEGAEFVEIDITPLVNAWREGSMPNYGVLLKATDETVEAVANLTAREYTVASLRPVLLVYTRNYQVPDYQDFPATLSVRTWDEADLAVSMTVQTDWGFSYLEGSLYVHRSDTPVPDDLPASLGVSRPDLPGSVAARRSAQGEIAASITVKGDEFSDLTIAISVSRPEMPSGIAARRSAESEITGSVTARQFGGFDLAASLAVSRADTPGSIAVFQHDSLNATLDVRAWTEDDLPSLLGVRVWAEADLPGSVGVTRGPNDLPGSIQVLSGYLAASIAVREGTWIAGYLTVRQRDASDLDATLTVGQQQTDGQVDLPAGLWVRRWDENHLHNTISVRRGEEVDLPASISITHHDSLPGSLFVTIPFSDLPASILVRVEASDDLSAQVTVWQISRIPGYLWVQQTDRYDLGASLAVSKPQIPAGLAVSRPGLPGSLAARQAARAEISASMAVSAGDRPGSLSVSRRSLPGSVLVLVRGSEALEASITVVSWDYLTDDLYFRLPPPYRPMRGRGER